MIQTQQTGERFGDTCKIICIDKKFKHISSCTFKKWKLSYLSTKSNAYKFKQTVHWMLTNRRCWSFYTQSKFIRVILLVKRFFFYKCQKIIYLTNLNLVQLRDTGFWFHQVYPNHSRLLNTSWYHMPDLIILLPYHVFKDISHNQKRIHTHTLQVTDTESTLFLIKTEEVEKGAISSLIVQECWPINNDNIRTFV